ncbi:hypothetical protein G6F22_014574 [Rhizopus arrhizus]|nr:hypothetical protein G6F22_014574 [Rhizopus arrhizus]
MRHENRVPGRRVHGAATRPKRPSWPRCVHCRRWPTAMWTQTDTCAVPRNRVPQCATTCADQRIGAGHCGAAHPACGVCGAVLKKRGLLQSSRAGDRAWLHHCRRSRCDWWRMPRSTNVNVGIASPRFDTKGPQEGNMSNGNGVSVVTDAVENVKETATNVGETIAHAAEDAVKSVKKTVKRATKAAGTRVAKAKKAVAKVEKTVAKKAEKAAKSVGKTPLP